MRCAISALIGLVVATLVVADPAGPTRLDRVRALGRIGHAGSTHVSTTQPQPRSIHAHGHGRRMRRHLKRYTPPSNPVFHLPLYPVSNGTTRRNYDAHLSHARTRHANALTLASSMSASNNGAGVSAKEIAAAAKNTVTGPSGTAADDSIGLSIEANDVGFFAPVTIGTPGTTFNILMDSGSADLWVPSSSCSTAACGPHSKIGATTSSTFQASTTRFAVTYGTGEVSGTLAKDTVTIAGLKLTGHVFGVATAESDDFSASSVPFDGLMGLAKSSLSNEGVLTPIDSLKAAGLIKVAQVGYALGRVADATNIGQITFGGVDATRFSGSLTLIDNVSKTGFWEGAMSAVSVNGKKLAALTGRSAILDTGTTLIVAPSADATAIHAAIPGSKTDGQGTFTVPCTTTASVALSFAGATFAIDPTDLAFQPVDPTDPTGDCQSGISAGQIGTATEWLVGDVFLKNVYYSTNVDTNQIGLAPIIAG